MNETINILKKHRSIRQFNQEPLSQQEEDEIISSSLRGATAGNMMLYSIIKIKDKNTIDFLSEKCDEQNFIKQSKFALLFVMDSYKFYTYFINRGMKDKFKNFKGPCVADLFLAMEDTMIAAQNAVIAAESMDIGTCYIGDILENKEDITNKFNLPKYTIPLCLVVFGKYEYTPKLRDRFSEKFVVFDETYPNIDEEFINGMFQKEETKQKDFCEKFYNRKINSDFFKEMERSILEYLKDWNDEYDKL